MPHVAAHTLESPPAMPVEVTPERTASGDASALLGPSAGDEADSYDDEHDGDAAHDARGAFPRLRRRWIVAGAAAAVVALGVWGVSQWATPHADVTLAPLVSVDGDSRLGVIEAQALQAFGVDTDDVREYHSYHALRTWVSSAPNGERCLAIYAGSYGPAGVSCTPRGLDPTVDVAIYDGMPEDIARGLPVGSVIRFVLTGDRVQVWERRAD